MNQSPENLEAQELRNLGTAANERSVMPAVTVSLIANYVKADLDAVIAFLGVAELCGYELIRTHSYNPEVSETLKP